MKVALRSSAGVVLAVFFIVLVGWPQASAAQEVTGLATAVDGKVYGLFGDTITTVLASTGTLNTSGDAREASQINGNVPFVLAAKVLHAAAVGNWNDRAASEASLSGLAVTVNGTTIGADFVMVRVVAVKNNLAIATASISELSINGSPVGISGAPNQTVAIPGGQIVINEQQASATGTVVNALHVTVSGLADLVIASATAGID